MKKVFFDTWGWVAIAHKGDSHHKEVSAFYEDFLLRKGIPLTTDYVLSETISLLRSRTEKGVYEFIGVLLEATKKDIILFERINEKRWEKAWQLCKKYKDKPYISFVDFTSFVIMKELVITEVLTNDKHFEDVGMGFRRLF